MIRQLTTALLIGLACLVTLLTSLIHHFTAEPTLAQAEADQVVVQARSVITFAPFLEMVPSQDGSELYIHVRGADQPGDVLFANLRIGPSGHKGSYTMHYSETVQSYVATAVGLTPEEDTAGQLNITTTLGLNTSNVDFQRAFVPAATRQTLQAVDGNLELSLVNTDTITFDTYAVIVPSYAPPGPLPPSHRLIGSAYSVRAAGALVQTERPMNLRLYYDEQQLAGADPHMLAIFAWDAAAQRWVEIGGRLFGVQQYLAAPVTRFTTYALLVTPAWQDEFDDFDGLEVAALNNVTLGGTLAERTLVLAHTPGSGSAVSRPITATAEIARWGTLTFIGTVDAATTTLTVDVLSVDGAVLLENVASGASLATIDRVQHPSLRLRVNLASTAAGQTPTLDTWRLTWQVKTARVYLPVVAKP
jgi:hypothetical protein